MNTFGVYDLDGNASEWVAGCWSEDMVLSIENKHCQHRIIREISWHGNSDADQQIGFDRQLAKSSDENPTVGFRIALSE